jgi:outer membrane protein assembly factor BamB
MGTRERLVSWCLGLAVAATAAECSASTRIALMAPKPLLQAPSSWMQFRLNPHNNAAIPGTLRVAWHLRTNGGFSSSPTVADETLYVGNNAGTLYAVDIRSGRVLWSYHVDNPLMSAPIIYDGVVIVTEGNENSPTNATPAMPIHVGAGPNAIIALNRETGKLAWMRALEGSGMPTPAIVDGVLVHHDGSGEIVGLDPVTGAVRYTKSLHSIASMVAALPLWGDRWVTAGEWSNSLWLLRASDGGVIWQSNFEAQASGVGDCPPVTDGLRIYCDYVVPPSTATQVVVGEGAYERAYAVDVATGKKVWDVRIDGGSVPPRNEAAIPLLADDTLYIGSSMETYMHAIDPATGRLKWQQLTHGPVLDGPVFADGILYYGDLGGYLWALNATTGQVVGDIATGLPFNVGSPIIAGQTLIIGSRGGTLIAVPLKVIRTTHAS